MRHPFILSACTAAVFIVAGCAEKDEDSVDRAFQDVNVIDESNLSDVMLTVADPNEAVAYFTRTLNEQPDRLDLRRNLASSYVRAKR